MTLRVSAAEVEAIVGTMRLPAIQIYPGDWLRDNVAGCSPLAQALWLRELFIMHDAKPYGHLVEIGSPMPMEALVRRTGFKAAECRRAHQELIRAGVPRRTGTEEYRSLFCGSIEHNREEIQIDFSPLSVAADNVLYSKRMITDQRLRVIRKLTGRLGGNPILVNHPLNALSTPSRARAGAEDENEKGSSSSVRKNEEPSPRATLAGSPDFAVVERLSHKIDNSGLRVLPSPQIVTAWLTEFGEELVSETLVDCEVDYRGKHYRYFEEILVNRRSNHERPGNRRSAASGRGPKRPGPVTLAGSN